MVVSSSGGGALNAVLRRSMPSHSSLPLLPCATWLRSTRRCYASSPLLATRWLPLLMTTKGLTEKAGHAPLCATTASRHSLFRSSPLLLLPSTGSALYQCGDCSKTFRLLNALNHHIMTKHGGKAKALHRMPDGKLEPVDAATATSSSKPASSVGTPKPAAPMTGFPSMAPFGGLTGTSFGASASHVAPTASASAEAAEPGEGSEADGEKQAAFVCTICQKTFRLEAALQHHYQAKHNMAAPASATAASSAGGEGASDGGTAVPGATSPAASEDATKGPATASEYVRQQEAELPTAPQYHLDVAPNAPDEADVAAHWRCNNFSVLMGIVQDIKTGYVFEDHVLQFTVATQFEAPSPGDPDKDFHLVRVYEESFWRPLKEELKDGDVVLVNGRLRMVPQYDAVLRKYYHHPVVQVFPGTGLAMKTG